MALKISLGLLPLTMLARKEGYVPVHQKSRFTPLPQIEDSLTTAEQVNGQTGPQVPMKKHKAPRPVFHVLLAFFHCLHISEHMIRASNAGPGLAVHCTSDTTITQWSGHSMSPPALAPLASARPLRFDAAEDVAKCFSSGRESLRDREVEEPQASKASWNALSGAIETKQILRARLQQQTVRDSQIPRPAPCKLFDDGVCDI